MLQWRQSKNGSFIQGSAPVVRSEETMMLRGVKKRIRDEREKPDRKTLGGYNKGQQIPNAVKASAEFFQPPSEAGVEEGYAMAISDHRDFMVGIASASQEAKGLQSIRGFRGPVSSCPGPQPVAWVVLIEPEIDPLECAIKLSVLQLLY